MEIIIEHHHKGRLANSHAYVICGYVDITYRDIDNNYCLYNSNLNMRQYVKYKEVTFSDTVDEAYKKAIHRYADAAK